MLLVYNYLRYICHPERSKGTHLPLPGIKTERTRTKGGKRTININKYKYLQEFPQVRSPRSPLTSTKNCPNMLSLRLASGPLGYLRIIRFLRSIAFSVHPDSIWRII